MSPDPLDELIEDLERIVAPADPAPQSVGSAILDIQFGLSRVLADDDEGVSEAEREAASRQLRRGMNRFLGREDEPES